MTDAHEKPGIPEITRRLLDPLLTRTLLLVGLTLAMLLPLDQLEDLIDERRLLHESVAEKIAVAWGGPQSLQGPLLAIPYVERIADGGTTHEVRRIVLLRPEALRADVRLTVEERRRGIYATPVYTARVTLAGRFDRFERAEFRGADVRLDTASAALIFRLPKATAETIRARALAIDGKPVPVSVAAAGGGFEAIEMPLPGWKVAGDGFAFQARLTLTGTRSLGLMASARSAEVRMTGDWPHPSFLAPRLPLAHEIDDDGFRAEWRLTAPTPDRAMFLANKGRPQWFPGVTIGVELFEPMSLYATMGRAVKYAVLFIALTFAACFAIEFASGVAMHIVQYGVVGLALALFYLTLLALAEHVVFWLAYLAAAGAIVAMITLYTWATLASLRRAGLVAAVLALLYATLFVILRMEDFALLSGSGVAMLALAALMLVTRRLRPASSTSSP